MEPFDQQSLFTPDPNQPPVKPAGALPVAMRVLITVKAAPNPSETYGETVCVAGIRLDQGETGWVRLYPVNFRELESDRKFKKYDIVSLQARPNHSDPRPESFRPLVTTVSFERKLRTWPQRRPFIVDQLHQSMCELLADARARPPSQCRSLAAIRPTAITGLDLQPHPGWTPDEQAKIDRYASQPDLFDRAPRTALQAPRFKGWYRYQCSSASCNGHRQGIYDWEFTALQHRLHRQGRPDEQIATELHSRFFDQICAPDNDVIFYVGNQAKRAHTFMVLGAFYPKR